MSCTTTCRKANGRQAHCAAEGCHQTFTTVSAFDHHRVGTVDERSCADPTERGMHLNAHGVWAREGGARFWNVRPQASVDTQSAERPSGVPASTPATPESSDTLPGGPEVWVDDPLPGGYVCAAPDPDGPDGICRMPVEDEPCPTHSPVTPEAAETRSGGAA